MSPAATVLLLLIGGALGAYLPRVYLRWRESRKPPWARVRAAQAWGPVAGQTRAQILGVSRHDIAECGLMCPVCRSLVAERGDFSRVQRMRINGVENEVIECLNVREVENGRDVPCETFLAASPDTEHGDHLDDHGKVDTNGAHDPPEYYRFVRITQAKAIAEKYDGGVWLGDDGASEGQSLMISSDEKPTERLTASERAKVATTRKHDVLAGEELRAALQIEIAKQAEQASTTPPKNPVDPRLAETDKHPVVTLPPPV